ncbi:MAG: hypothetical protein AVDCRST_MAG49-4174, partial [uncultured Thermomicrobiales bacterium]
EIQCAEDDQARRRRATEPEQEWHRHQRRRQVRPGRHGAPRDSPLRARAWHPDPLLVVPGGGRSANVDAGGQDPPASPGGRGCPVGAGGEARDPTVRPRRVRLLAGPRARRGPPLLPRTGPDGDAPDPHAGRTRRLVAHRPPAPAGDGPLGERRPL